MEDIMGIGDFIKQQVGIGRLPDSEINEVTVYKYLKGQVPFVVTLPKLETITTGSYSSISATHYGVRTTYFDHPKTKKVFRKVKAGVQHTNQQIIIFHAFENGKHAFVNLTKPFKVSKIKDGLVIEEYDGSRYYFEMDNEIKNFWKTKGFKPQAIVDVFYNLLFGILPAKIQQQINRQNAINQQQINRQNAINQKKAQEEAYQQELIKRHEEMDKRAEKNRIKREKERKKEEQEKLNQRRQKEKEKEIKLKKQIEKEEKQKQEVIQQRKDINSKINKIFDEFPIKIKTLKETYDLNAINQEEYDELKNEFIHEINSLPIPNDINHLSKIKETKELLDMEAITEEEFEKIKSRYLKKI